MHASSQSPPRRRSPNSHNGQMRWFRDLASPSESSPLIDRGRIFFGSESGTVYALNDSDGRLLWDYHAAGAVKASPTLSGGNLYFGDYSGHIQAISERNGRLIWRSGSGGTVLGSGTLYSKCAVYYGPGVPCQTHGPIYRYDA